MDLFEFISIRGNQRGFKVKMGKRMQNEVIAIEAQNSFGYEIVSIYGICIV